MRRAALALTFLAALAFAQLRNLSARLDLATEPVMPARVYLFKDGRPFRLSPVDAMLPLRVDLFYRERLWRRVPDPATLEVTCNDISHFFLLKGRAGFDLPPGNYRVEAYRGLFYKPAVREFTLRPGETSRITLRMDDWTHGASREWLSSDDHIHLVRDALDDKVFLEWMEAEDLSSPIFFSCSARWTPPGNTALDRRQRRNCQAGPSAPATNRGRSSSGTSICSEAVR